MPDSIPADVDPYSWREALSEVSMARWAIKSTPATSEFVIAFFNVIAPGADNLNTFGSPVWEYPPMLTNFAAISGFGPNPSGKVQMLFNDRKFYLDLSSGLPLDYPRREMYIKEQAEYFEAIVRAGKLLCGLMMECTEACYQQDGLKLTAFGEAVEKCYDAAINEYVDDNEDMDWRKAAGSTRSEQKENAIKEREDADNVRSVPEIRKAAINNGWLSNDVNIWVSLKNRPNAKRNLPINKASRCFMKKMVMYRAKDENKQPLSTGKLPKDVPREVLTITDPNNNEVVLNQKDHPELYHEKVKEWIESKNFVYSPIRLLNKDGVNLNRPDSEDYVTDNCVVQGRKSWDIGLRTIGTLRIHFRLDYQLTVLRKGEPRQREGRAAPSQYRDDGDAIQPYEERKEEARKAVAAVLGNPAPQTQQQNLSQEELLEMVRVMQAEKTEMAEKLERTLLLQKSDEALDEALDDALDEALDKTSRKRRHFDEDETSQKRQLDESEEEEEEEEADAPDDEAPPPLPPKKKKPKRGAAPTPTFFDDDDEDEDISEEIPI